MKNKYRRYGRLMSFVYSLALTAFIIWCLHHLLTTGAAYMPATSYKFLVGATFVLLIMGFIRIIWTFRKWRESRREKNNEVL